MSNVNQFEKKQEDNIPGNYPRAISTSAGSSTPSQIPTPVIPTYVEPDIGVQGSGHVRYNPTLPRQALLNTSAPLPAMPVLPQVSAPQISLPHRPGPVIGHAAHSVSDAALIATSINTSHPNISGLSHVLASGLAPSVHSAGHTQVQQQFQRLKVEDALSYLDQVKFQFGNQPQVYNDFLDIMKEFKSQSIDTPGVIARVSNLFNGHPDLIVGFNTFLPPGYKIEVSANDQVSVTGPNMVSQTIQPGNGGTTIQIHTPGNKYITHTTQPLAPRSQSSDNKPSDQAAIIIPTSMQQPVFTPSSAPSGPVPTPPAPNSSGSQPSQNASQSHGSSNQPVEFNHAISYVNKIKNRFQGQTDIYKSFLEILHKYQKEQRTVKESSGAYKPSLSETEVYSQVARLFKNDEDLLREFGQFLPDAGGAASAATTRSMVGSAGAHGIKSEGISDGLSTISKASMAAQNHPSGNKVQRPPGQSLKRPQIHTVTAKSSSLKDVSVAEASKHGTLKEYEFFDHVRKALGSQEVYENFLRCILLYNNEIIGRAELVQLVQPFLSKYTELFIYFKKFLAYKDDHTSESHVSQGLIQGQHTHLPQGKEKLEGMAMEIDYTTLKRLGSSYRALPPSYEQPRCSGRDALCREVLNDTWVSFPSWSEDSQFVTSRKTQFEEHVYRCEDERFELDVVIETNRATMLVLENVQKKLHRLSEEEKSKFTLNNCLGGTSEVVHRKSIHRIYGDKASDIIEGLKKNTAIAVPVVLKRLKLKDEEWREAQHQFNKLWGEQNEKYYLKSLDHQGINFKPNDIKFIRSKSLLNEIEAIYDERQEALESDAANIPTGPHMTLTYEDKSIIDDTASIIIHHVKRQSGINKDDKQTMKTFMYQTLPDLFFSPRGNQPSDDEDDTEDQDYEVRSNSRKLSKRRSQQKLKSEAASGGYKAGDNVADMYHLLMANNHFYLFFRLHHLICKRLLIIQRQSEKLIQEHAKESKKETKESVAELLHLKKDIDVKVEDYYPAFLELVRNLLDGNIESSQFEDLLRGMFTIHAYIGFTMDRLVQNIVKQLQHIVQDEQCIQLLDMFSAEERVGATGGPLISQGKRAAVENAYSKKAEMLLTEENCFKILICQKDKQMHLGIILLDTDELEEDEMEPASFARWSQYVDHYAKSRQEITSDIKDGLGKKPVFLQRNAKLLKNRPKPEEEEEGVDRGCARSYNIEIKFAPNSYKIKYVPDTEDIMYRLGANKSSKSVSNAVSKRLHDKFTIWHTNWERESVSRDMSRQTSNWLMGKIDGLLPCTTVCRVEKDNGLTKNMYRVEYQEQEPME